MNKVFVVSNVVEYSVKELRPYANAEEIPDDKSELELIEVHTWMDASLREIRGLIKEAHPRSRDTQHIDIDLMPLGGTAAFELSSLVPASAHSSVSFAPLRQARYQAGDVLALTLRP